MAHCFTCCWSRSFCVRLSPRAPIRGHVEGAFRKRAGRGAITSIGFDKDEAGKPPAGWMATQTGSGQAQWTVIADASAPSQPNVLKQSGTATYPCA